MVELLSILKILLSTTVQGFLLKYITLSYIIWFKNCRLSDFDENIGISFLKHFGMHLCYKLVYICVLYLKIKMNIQKITYHIDTKLSFSHTL